MSGEITIYHNPRCSKSRQTLQLLQERCESIRVVEYLRDPPSAGEIERVAEMLGVHPRDLVRTKEPEYGQAGLGPKSSASEVIAAIVEHPKLLERPIVVHDGKAAIGRPPEKVLDILD